MSFDLSALVEEGAFILAVLNNTELGKKPNPPLMLPYCGARKKLFQSVQINEKWTQL